MKRVVILITVLSLFALGAVPTATAGPYVCDHTGSGMYQCYGVVDGCVYEWEDDDSDGDPHDGNSTVETKVCSSQVTGG